MGAYSKELYYLLKKPVDLERIRPCMEHYRECMAVFLKGLADAEGNADTDEEHLGHISIGNSDLQLLEYAASLFLGLGISARIYKRKMKSFSN